jgi:hypothetical protein
MSSESPALKERRREIDKMQQQIEDLIVAADNPKDKAFLLIMNKIAVSLDTNTFLTQSLSDEFQAHTTAFKNHEAAELALIHQSKGGIRVGMWFLGIIQLIVIAVASSQLAEIKEMKQELLSCQITLNTHTEQIKTLQLHSIHP